MPTTTKALSTPSSGAPLAPTTIERRDLRGNDVLIDIAFAGICHSDIHQARSEWGEASFPMVPGHEIAGTVAAVGPEVTAFKVGDRVGVGCMVDSCGVCEFCKDGEENYCRKKTVWTYNDENYDGEPTFGGYSQQIVVSDRFVVNIPEGIELDEAAPLLCAGITTYSPLVRWGAGPGKKVGVVGLGGLGHMAVKLAAALGAEVTVLSRTDAKADDAEKLGAKDFRATADGSAFEEFKDHFDLIVNTVSADLPMDSYLGMVKPLGVMVNVGLPSEPYSVQPGSVVGDSKVLAGSNIGGIPQTQEMLNFCAEHGIGATIEKISADQVNDAYNRVVDGDVRYRVVIDTATI
ncbi:NAD(P)-dependent alcohol dehydrogenase [Nakamurella aerolata]|uniref:alcohol dehydrogenase (NADP(+)) n=1 Tax=Nakamurella aerolata TaxID=1656892 RepID=A0A849ACC4_9ACTN|nr:NAD(P)-dependent alcohol dehydrogenase [Nakamurella aerolata]NNG37567.1 NAD(P)-dependent alcohol dehydrogenase [Nakamurella aerolata]